MLWRTAGVSRLVGASHQPADAGRSPKSTGTPKSAKDAKNDHAFFGRSDYSPPHSADEIGARKVDPASPDGHSMHGSRFHDRPVGGVAVVLVTSRRGRPRGRRDPVTAAGGSVQRYRTGAARGEAGNSAGRGRPRRLGTALLGTMLVSRPTRWSIHKTKEWGDGKE